MLSFTLANKLCIVAPSNSINSAVPYQICVASALYRELSSINADTDKANHDMAQTYGTGLTLIGPGAAVKYGLGSAVTASGLLNSLLAGMFVKSYLFTLPSWTKGVLQAQAQYNRDVKACGGS